MPHLLTLPRELRDMIIENIVLGPQIENELATTHFHPIQESNLFIARKKLPFLNFTTTLKPQIPPETLFLTCKQLNHETKHVLRLLGQRALDYEIEAKYVQRSAWFLTWKHIPKLECCINRLHVSIRTIGVLPYTPFTYTWGSSSGLEHLVPLVFTMFQRLFCPGKAIWVEHLEIDFISSKEVKDSPLKDEASEQWCRSLGLVHDQSYGLGMCRELGPETLCSLLREDFEGALAGARVLDLEFSLKLAWFGDVTLKVDGVKMTTIDVRTRLGSLQPSGLATTDI